LVNFWPVLFAERSAGKEACTKEMEEKVAEKLRLLRKIYYLSPYGEDRMHLENENKSQFILHFARFSLSLQSSTG